MELQGSLELINYYVKNLPSNPGDIRDMGSIPGSGISLGEENGNPLQYSCLENPMDRGVWWALVHRVTKSQKQLKQLSIHTKSTSLKTFVIYVVSYIDVLVFLACCISKYAHHLIIKGEGGEYRRT